MSEIDAACLSTIVRDRQHLVESKKSVNLSPETPDKRCYELSPYAGSTSKISESCEAFVGLKNDAWRIMN
jgi:hypothetical protein